MLQLAKAHSFVTKKTNKSIPILQEVAANGKLQSTNLDCWLFTENPNLADGGYYIKGNSFYKNESKLEDFPACVLGEQIYSLPVIDFLPSIFEAVNFASKETMRPQMQCVLLRLSTDHVKVVSTNGHYLFHKKFDSQNTSLFDVLMPGESVKILKQLFTLFKPKEVGMQIFKKSGEYPNGYAKFMFSNIEFVIRLCGEPFPPFESVVPLDFESKMIFKTDELLKAAKSIQEVLDNKTDHINFLFDGAKYNLYGENDLLNINKTEQIENQIGYSGLKDIQDNFALLMPVRLKDGKQHEQNIAFNCQYLLDCLKVVQSEFITIHWNRNTKAVLLLEGK